MFDMKCLRKRLGVGVIHRIRIRWGNKAPLLKRVDQCNLRWFGHMK